MPLGVVRQHGRANGQPRLVGVAAALGEYRSLIERIRAFLDHHRGRAWTSEPIHLLGRRFERLERRFLRPWVGVGASLAADVYELFTRACGWSLRAQGAPYGEGGRNRPSAFGQELTAIHRTPPLGGKPNLPFWFFHSDRAGIASIVSQCSAILPFSIR